MRDNYNSNNKTIITIKLFHIIIRSYIQYTRPSYSLTSVCPVSTRSQAPLPRFQIRIVLSPDVEARRPSGSTVRESTIYIYKRVGVINSNKSIIIINLFLSDIIRSYIQYTYPSTYLTSECPSNTRTQAPLPRFQIRIVLSCDPEARRPSRNTAKEDTPYEIDVDARDINNST